MRITMLAPAGDTYSSNVYYLRGDWNRLEDRNTLIDTGRDPRMLERLQAISGGLGKRLVEQIVLTHGHYDHAELLPELWRRYQPVIRAFEAPRTVPGFQLSDGERIPAGDGHLVVYHVPIHSQDSVCLYCPQAKALFAGDTPLLPHWPEPAYDARYVRALEAFTRLPIEIIYFGHGQPLQENCTQRLRESLALVSGSCFAALPQAAP